MQVDTGFSSPPTLPLGVAYSLIPSQAMFCEVRDSVLSATSTFFQEKYHTLVNKASSLWNRVTWNNTLKALAERPRVAKPIAKTVLLYCARNKKERHLYNKCVGVFFELNRTNKLTPLIDPVMTLFFSNALQVPSNPTTLLNEISLIKSGVNRETRQLTTQLKSLDILLKDPVVRHAIRETLTVARTVSTDPEFRVLGKASTNEIKGPYWELTLILCELIYEGSGWDKANDGLFSKIHHNLQGNLWKKLSNDKNGKLFDQLYNDLMHVLDKYETGHEAPLASFKHSKELVKSTANKVSEIINGTTSQITSKIIKAHNTLAKEELINHLFATRGFYRAPAAADFFAEQTNQFLLNAMTRSQVTKEYFWTDFFKVDPLGLLTTSIYTQNHEHMKSVIETLFLKIMGKLAEKITTKTREDPDFMPDLATSLITVFTESLEKFNQYTSNGTVKLTEEDLLQKFKDFNLGLHPLSSDEGKSERVGKVFKDMSIKLTDILIPEGAEVIDFGVEIPAKAREDLWILLKETALPWGFCALFNLMTSENTIDNALLASFKTLEKTLDANAANEINGTKAAHSSPTSVSGPSAARQALNESCSDLLKQISKLLPKTSFNFMMKYKKIKTLSGKLLGDQIYKLITTGGWDMNKIIDVSLELGLPNMHKGRWEVDNEGHPHFIPLDGKGKEMLKPLFAFQNTREERNLYEENRKIAAAKIAKELSDVSLRVSDKAIQVGVRTIVVNKLIEGINTFLSLILEEETVKALGPIVDFIADFFYTITFGIFWFILRPFWLWILSNGLETSLAHTHNPIIESPLHGMFEEIINSLS